VTPTEFEQAYDRLAAALDAAGEGAETIFLTRLVLLLADTCPDLDTFVAALDAAAELSPPGDA